ncbi:DUF3967 domain-containing protein [Priestia megaterium]
MLKKAGYHIHKNELGHRGFFKFEDFKEKQMKFNQKLLKQIQQRDEYISKKLENRHREFLDAVKGIQETQKFIAASEEKKKK